MIMYVEKNEFIVRVGGASCRVVLEQCADGLVAQVTGWEGTGFEAGKVYMEGLAAIEAAGCVGIAMYTDIERAAGELGEFYEEQGFVPKLVVYHKRLKQ